MSIVEHRPSLADWWAGQETKIGANFRNDQNNYTDMKLLASTQGSLLDYDDEGMSCFCGD